MRNSFAKISFASAPILAALLLAPPALAEHLLADPALMLKTAKRVDFVGHNTFAVETLAEGRFLRSTPQKSASGLYQQVDLAAAALSKVTWTWRVDALQPSGDLRSLKSEDSGATIFFIFGEPSFFNKDVPTIAYAWTGTPVAEGTVIPSKRFSSLRYVQLHGRDTVGKWEHETRDVAADFRRLFGREPEALKYIAVFDDNDQTGEAASALFGRIVDAR